jgi:hypothetical protein
MDAPRIFAVGLTNNEPWDSMRVPEQEDRRMPDPREIAEAVLNPSEDGEIVIKEAADALAKMDAFDGLLFLSTIRSEADKLVNDD